MNVYCIGTAIIVDKASGRQFEIQDSDLDWDNVGGGAGPMGEKEHYLATVEHEVLGKLSWSLWEYPVGVQNCSETDTGGHRLVQDFDYGLEHEEEFDLEQLEDEERAVARLGFEDLTEEEQIDTMVGWFNRMFEDPQNSTPYAIDKDSPYNYEYIWGGPYDASDELFGEFGDIASEEAIEQAAKTVQNQDGIFEWAPSNNHPVMRQRDEDALAEQFQFEQSLYEIRRRAREKPELTTGTESEISARRELVALAKDLEPLLMMASEERSHGGIGHNQPPEEFRVPHNLSLKLNVNINVIVSQADETEPDVEAVAESVGVIQKALAELKDFVKLTKDQVKTKGAKTLANVIVGGIGLLILKGIIWLSAMLGIPLL